MRWYQNFRRQRASRTEKHRGQALVEFALIIGLLLLIVMGIFDFGRAFIIYSNIFNAAREGARMGAVYPWYPLDVEDRVLTSIVIVNATDVEVDVCCDTGPGEPNFFCDLTTNPDWSCGGGGGTGPEGMAGIGDRIVVSTTYTLELITPIISTFFPELPIRTQAARTIATYAEAYQPPGGGGGGPPPPPDDESSYPSGCSNGVDDDGDGYVDCADSDCVDSPDCTITSERSYPNGCNNSVDDDNDGMTDCDDPDCFGEPVCNPPPEICDNGIDDDYDFKIDCVDPDCAEDPYCQAPPPPTSTPTPTPTPTVDPSEQPIVIDVPLCIGDTEVTGLAQPGMTIYLRNVNTGFEASTVVQPDKTFTFNVPALAEGDLIVVQGYGSSDYAIVINCDVTPTPTPTQTATPTPTPTPVGAWLSVDPDCSDVGSGVNVTVYGHNWAYQNKNDDITVDWNNAFAGEFFADAQPSEWSLPIVVEVISGTNTVDAYNSVASASTVFTAPCVLHGPNLVIDNLSLLTSPPISTYQDLQFEVTVSNIGDEAANNLFWVDLYYDEEPPTAAPSAAWSAIGSLAAGASVNLTIDGPGLMLTGTHLVYAFADTWDQVVETDEADNVGGPLPVDVGAEGPTPTPTATPPGDTGAIEGITFLLREGNATPLARAYVYCYDGGTLIASTISDETGNYRMEGIPAGTDYTVMAEAFIDGVLYSDSSYPVEVTAGGTSYVSLFLH
ncbi:MAG: pilus assembly protein [Anaerolineae bacterium]|nr:pilus assembly protein [Anaerolineae bacterium]